MVVPVVVGVAIPAATVFTTIAIAELLELASVGNGNQRKSVAKIRRSQRRTSESGGTGGCDIFQGKWVYDDNQYPLYAPQTCPFVSKQLDHLDCQNNGRPDHDYVKYRWVQVLASYLENSREENHVCWGLCGAESMAFACLHDLFGSSKCHLFTQHQRNPFYTLLPAYNVSVMFSRNDFLADVVVGDKNERILKLDSVENGGAIWKDADIFVFNTWNQGLQTGKNKSWDIIEEGKAKYKDMDPLVAYGKALKTWANWVNSSVDTNKNKIFFQGLSPDHFNKRDWANPNANNCRGQARPVPGPITPGGRHPGEAVLEKVLKEIPKVVHLLNVTAMSQLRKDGHPSIYGTEDVDCSNWCLPGVPDAWNELLYASLWGYC